MASGEAITMLNRFKGCMLGALVGDCIGAEFEFLRGESLVPRHQILAHVAAVKAGKRADMVDRERYTDDTAMARQIALSFIEEKKLDTSRLARRFTEEYFAEPERGYGGAVREVFSKLRDQEYREPHGPAAEQFGGSGSYGNGAGMRAHPVGMAMVRAGQGWRVEEAAGQVARITHSHELGVMGGGMQAVAVYHALNGSTPGEIRSMVESLVEDSLDYSIKLGVLHRSLSLPLDQLEEVVLGHEEAQGLGNGVAALESVPTALFCYLRVLGEEWSGGSEEEKQALFEDILVMAIQCGGDTDTIASMACALAGATLGVGCIAPELLARCEASEELGELATQMWGVVVEQEREEEEQETPSDAKKPRL